jgi:hypothetical protein
LACGSEAEAEIRCVARFLELTLTEAAYGAPIEAAWIEVCGPNTTLEIESDAQGLARIEVSDSWTYLSFRVRRVGFVPKVVSWRIRQPDSQLPEQFTLKMERGHRIGGVVRNEDGAPVENANVLITLRGSSTDREGPQIHNDIFERKAPTNAEGRWHFDEAPADWNVIHLRLEHPDYISNEELHPLPAAENFRNETAVLTILRGPPCEGTVTDAEGHPVEGVTVTLGEYGQSSCAVPTRLTDAEGSFRFGGISLKPHHSNVLCFLKEGLAPELIELQQVENLRGVKVALRKGRPLRVQFTDKEGMPIAGVVTAFNHWRLQRPFHLRFESNEVGLMRWDDAPEDAVGYVAMHESFTRQDIKLTAGDDVQTVVLQRPMSISGRVIDAQTREPIPEFRLTTGRVFHEEREWSDWAHAQPRTFTAGKYLVSSTWPVTLMNREGGPGEVGFRRVRIDAPGYQPGISREIANEEEMVICDFELEKGANAEGVVRDPAGRPVANISVVVTGGCNPVFVRNGETLRNQDFTVKTDANGRYALPPQEEDVPIVVLDREAGYAFTSWNALRAAPDIQLRPWGRFELATTSGLDAKVNYYLWPLHDYRTQERVHFDSSPESSRDGVWIFEGLPAGEWRLGTYGQGMNKGPVVIITDGETTRMDLRSKRRSITGQIAPLSPGLAREEPLAHLRLRTRWPRPEVPPGLTDAEQRTWFENWRQTPEGRALEEASFETMFLIDGQGKFRIDDLKPGPYMIVAIFFRSLPKSPNSQPDVAGIAAKEFELVEGKGPWIWECSR